MTGPRRYLYIVSCSLVVGTLSGYLVGKDDFVYQGTCPAVGPCPSPFNARNAFHLGNALVAGGIVAVIVFVLLAAASRVSRRANRLP
jgi:hypothetical protein